MALSFSAQQCQPNGREDKTDRERERKRAEERGREDGYKEKRNGTSGITTGIPGGSKYINCLICNREFYDSTRRSRDGRYYKFT